jgi:hypothetical protein
MDNILHKHPKLDGVTSEVAKYNEIDSEQACYQEIRLFVDIFKLQGGISIKDKRATGSKDKMELT